MGFFIFCSFVRLGGGHFCQLNFTPSLLYFWFAFSAFSHMSCLSSMRFFFLRLSGHLKSTCIHIEWALRAFDRIFMPFMPAIRCVCVCVCIGGAQFLCNYYVWTLLHRVQWTLFMQFAPTNNAVACQLTLLFRFMFTFFAAAAAVDAIDFIVFALVVSSNSYKQL